MPIKQLAVLAVFCSTAVPTSLLGLQVMQEGKIPACGSHAGSSERSCIESTSGLRFAVSRYEKMGP